MVAYKTTYRFPDYFLLLLRLPVTTDVRRVHVYFEREDELIARLHFALSFGVYALQDRYSLLRKYHDVEIDCELVPVTVAQLPIPKSSRMFSARGNRIVKPE